MRNAIVLLAPLLALVAIAAACADDEGGQAATQSPQVDAPTPTASPPTGGGQGFGSFEDEHDFRAFGSQLDAALKGGDVQFFLDNATFQDFTCRTTESGFPVPPQSCAGQPEGAVVASIGIGVENSEGYAADTAQYEGLIREFLEDFLPAASDAYGGSEPQLYAYGISRAQPGAGAQDTETVHAITTGIYAGSREEQRRRILRFDVTYDGGQWRITGVLEGIAPYHLDPKGDQAVAEGFDGYDFWQRWDGPIGPTGGAPADLVAVRDALPLYPGATIAHPGAETESALWSGYVVQADVDTVVEFYRQELPAQGWQAEEPPVVIFSADENFSAQYESVVSFIKEDIRVAILVTPGEKDATPTGETILSIVVERP